MCILCEDFAWGGLDHGIVFSSPTHRTVPGHTLAGVLDAGFLCPIYLVGTCPSILYFGPGQSFQCPLSGW
jgi:hypothetical protein